MVTFELTPDMLATGRVGVKMRAPVYADLRKSRKLFPYDKAESGERLGYLPDDLLLVDLLVELNGQELPHTVDLIDRLAYLPLADRQAVSAILTDTFYLSKELANLAADKASESQKDPNDFRTLLAKDSPSGELQIRFQVPNANVQVICEQKFNGIAKHGVGFEEFLFAYCITDIGADDVRDVKDKLALLDNFDIADVQYAGNYFVACSTISADARADLKKHSLGIRQQLQKQRVASTVTTAAVVPTALG